MGDYYARLNDDTNLDYHRLLYICMADMELRGLHNREVGKF